MRLESKTNRWIGKSWETKPYVGQVVTADDGTTRTLTTLDVPAGSTFLEDDVFRPDGSPRISRFNGTNWAYPLDIADGQAPILQALLDLNETLEFLRTGMIDAGYCTELRPAS